MFSHIFKEYELINKESFEVVISKSDTQIIVNIKDILFAFDHAIKKFIPAIDYIFLLVFFLSYLLCIFLFRCSLITYLFVTHRIIMRKLRKLNSDITHSTELENSKGINIEKTGIEIGTDTKTKKTRNVADEREIEKELQDILNDMQQIPFIMCRPNVVIVFDELDKVEPGDSCLEKENSQTKASMFSINATRERQTEILKILSNMKYFLSTARAKFIFIAGREMYDIHLADVSERNNYIGSIFNVVILVPSFLTDHHKGRKSIPQESSITSLPEEFVCRKLIPHDYPVESYDLKNYRIYLEKEIFCINKENIESIDYFQQEKIEKIIAVLQQFIVYLAHVSKGAPKKIMQLFESFVEIRTEREDSKNILLVQNYHSSRHFLSFNYYKQYTIGIIAYLITPIFYRLAESNIKEHSDKLLVSSLRFVDFLFKFHKHSFSWKHLDMSPEMLEVNRAPELKSVVVDLLNYLTQIHINKSNFSLSDYKFDGLIANEIFAMTKTDEVFSALFSFSLDEMLPLKKHYQDLLRKKENEYQKKKRVSVYVDAISSLQGVLGDLHYYDDELEEAEAYYKSVVQSLRYLKQKKDIIGEKGNEKESEIKMILDQLYVYVRNMLRLGIIYEKRKQYDFAYLTYGKLCELIISELNTINKSLFKKIAQIFTSNNNNMPFEKMTYEGLKMLYLPFIAKLQILEKSHMGGIVYNHLEQLDAEINNLTSKINQEAVKLLKAEFYSRVADVLYYKNINLKNLSCDEYTKNSSCTACNYYFGALLTLLNMSEIYKSDININKKIIKKLLCESVKLINYSYDMKYCTILARILSDWGNVFFSCSNNDNSKFEVNSNEILANCINYLASEEENNSSFSSIIDKIETNEDIAFVMYSISSVAYRKASIYKRSSFQMYKILSLFKKFKYNEKANFENYLEILTNQSIHYLWYANEDLNILELNKRKNYFSKERIDEKIPLQYLLVDTEITRIRILAKELELKSDLNKKPKEPGDIKKYYDILITSPYEINYSIIGRIYRLRLKSKINYEAYQLILENLKLGKDTRKSNFILDEAEYNKLLTDENCINIKNIIFGDSININEVFASLIAESIYCLIDIAQLSETMDETYLFPQSFFGSIHEHLSFWTRQYEIYETYKEKDLKLKELLEQYLDEEWRDLLSGYRENQRALSHYYKCLEIHKEGRAYHNIIDTMCYIRDDFNDRSDHFNIAKERYKIVKGIIDEKINEIKYLYNDSELYKVENYYE